MFKYILRKNMSEVSQIDFFGPMTTTSGFGHPIFKHDFGSMYLGLKTLQIVLFFKYFVLRNPSNVAWLIVEESDSKY